MLDKDKEKNGFLDKLKKLINTTDIDDIEQGEGEERTLKEAVAPAQRGRKKAAKSTKLVATPLLFVCISLRFQSLCERSIQYFSGLRKSFFPIFSFSETCTNCIQYSYMLLFTFPYGVSCNDFLTEFSHFFR